MIAFLAPQLGIICVVRDIHCKENVLKPVRIGFLRFNAFQSNNTSDLHDVFLKMSNDIKAIDSFILIIYGSKCSQEHEMASL